MPQDDAWPPAFTLDQERILDLLTGDRFYSNASASLREAVLNAVDAVTRQHAEKASHEARIDVVFHRQDQTLTVSDNGDGMSSEQVAGLFARVGASASRLARPGASPVGEFGIGVVSYFMAADRFDLETFDGQDEPIGLSFYKQMFAGGQATEFPPARTERGTTLRLFVRDADTYTTLLERFPHWCRGVQGLKASEVPRGPLKQGDLGVRQVGAVAVKLPTGIERATLRPVGAKTAWDAMTGSSRVTILYRGVFVQDYVAKGLWGMEGSVHVDPKHFRPRLNREGFVGDSFKLEIDSFLRGSHPIVLASLAQSLGNASAEGKLDEWSTRRWATLWLSVPRDAAYSHAASQWDAVFRRIPAFELAEGSKWIAATVDDLVKINGTIFVAPHPNEGQNDLIKSATRLLRETGRPVMRGLAREPGWLREAGAYFATTADLVTSQFKDELPKLQMIAPNAEAILDDLRVSYVLYTGEHPVELVALGEEAPPVLRVGQRLLVNTDVQLGRLFVLRCVELNRGRRGLIEIAADIMPQQLTSVVAVVKAEATDDDETFGLVKRRYVRSLIS